MSLSSLRLYLYGCLFLLPVVLNSGCNRGDGVLLGEVTGVVTLDGDPISDASVSFHPATGRGSFGKTNADGRYELKYIKSKGATLGTHKVTITTKVWGESGRTLAPGRSARDAAAAAASESRDEMLPEKYRFKESTVLSVEVKAGKNEHNFELTSELN